MGNRQVLFQWAKTQFGAVVPSGIWLYCWTRKFPYTSLLSMWNQNFALVVQTACFSFLWHGQEVFFMPNHSSPQRRPRIECLFCDGTSLQWTSVQWKEAALWIISPNCRWVLDWKWASITFLNQGPLGLVFIHCLEYTCNHDASKLLFVKLIKCQYCPGCTT